MEELCNQIWIYLATSYVKVMPNLLSVYKEGAIVTLPQQHEICTWKNGCLNNFIGSGTEGNSDGIASSCQLYKPTGVCVEFDNVVYFTDYLTASVKITSTLSHTGIFLEAIGKLMKAYSIHEKRYDNV